jgi:hypothetical protein
MEAAEAEAARSSGLSCVLFESRVQADYESLLDEAPDSVKSQVKEILIERGYEPDFEPYQAGENECQMTGIDIDCCPCGQHP